MAALKSKARAKLPASAFAYPAVRKYPIHDKAHARNALSQAAKSNTYGTYAHVAARVRARYGSAITTGGKRKTSTRRGRTTRSRRRR